MFLVEWTDEASSLDGEQRYRFDILWLRTAHDDLFHAPIPAGDQIRVPEEKPSRSYRGHHLYVRGRLPHEIRVIVLKIPSRANVFRPARRGRARRKSR